MEMKNSAINLQFSRKYSLAIVVASVLIWYTICPLLYSKINSQSPRCLPLSGGERRGEQTEGNSLNSIEKYTFDAAAQSVKRAILDSWSTYKRCGWGLDELHPISCRGSQWMGAALTMIDSLDTLLIIEADSELRLARKWIVENLQFDHDGTISVFEATIRLIGGLISTYTMTGDHLYAEKARELGRIVFSTFGKSATLPHRRVNLYHKSGRPTRWISLAALGSIQLELNELANITGIERYAVAGLEVYHKLHKMEKTDGLLQSVLNASDGSQKPDSRIRIGAGGDSYFEYLLKVWIQTGKVCSFLRDDYLLAIDGIRKRLSYRTHPNKLLYLAELWKPNTYSHRMEHLACFLPGTLALGVHHGMPKEHLELAEDLIRTCYEMYNLSNTGLAPDVVQVSTKADSSEDMCVEPSDEYNLLRPETMESLFYLYYITQKPVYREWGIRIFNAFEQHAKLPTGGYAAIEDVTNSVPTHMDRMDSFWISETLKYAYLLFNDSAAALFPLDRWVFNTEGHPLPISTNGDSMLNRIYRSFN